MLPKFSAKLRSAVTEFLFPRLEIGLRHASVSQKQCDAWLSLVIFTICERSGMNSSRNLNRSAFCILSGIPNLWLRTQTSRAAELFVTLNSVNSPAGETTRARLCSISGQPNVGLAIQRLNALKKFNNETRLVTSLKYLRQLGLEIKPRGVSEEPAVTTILHELKETFNKYPSAIVYTDGSTEPGGKSPNSGCGIYVTDLEHNPIWSGGMVVRADGNNFIAEIAAAAVVIKACPNSDFCLKLRIDSTAAIGAITKGYVSERKRIRAAGRAWRNLCRRAYCEKKTCISVEHVTSHQDLITPESKGNDRADKLANDFRLLSANDAPHNYLTSTEEMFILSHGEKTIQSDPRNYMKNLESEVLHKDWKSKAPRQVEWFQRHPTQILKQSKLVWQWAVKKGDGRAWVYFILGICQWLPTAHRLHGYLNDRTKSQCCLCLSGAEETLEHILVCPALANEHFGLKYMTLQKLQELQFPFSAATPKLKLTTCQTKFKDLATPICLRAGIPQARIERIIKDYCVTNHNKPFLSTRQFLKSLHAVLKDQKLNPSSPDESLVKILIQECSLSVHLFTDVLNYSSLVTEWHTNVHVNVNFGGKILASDSDFLGKSGFVYCDRDDLKSSVDLLNRLSKIVQGKFYTRFVCLVPSAVVNGNGITLAQFGRESPILRGTQDQNILACQTEMSVVLITNKASMLVDPINWGSLRSRLSSLSQSWTSGRMFIPDATDARFRERTLAQHAPRVGFPPIEKLEFLRQPQMYSFFDGWVPIDPHKAQASGIPVQTAKLIDKANSHPCFLSILGILPNQLRKLLKNVSHDVNKDIENLSCSLFFAGYKIWRKRQTLIRKYWKESAPENRPIRKSSISRKIRIDSQSNCQNIFHYMPRHSNYSGQRPTRCLCTHVPHKEKSFRDSDITAFIKRFCILEPSISYPVHWTTRTDIIRHEQDRVKIHLVS